MEINSNEIEIDLKLDFLRGDKGEKGEMGLPNSIAIGVVEKGEEAGAEIIGDAPNQVLNLVLPKGDKGEKGDTGESGPPNTITIGSIEKGEEAGATITGEAPNQVLNLVLPKGDKGDKGEKGDTGDRGLTGGVNTVNGMQGDVIIDMLHFYCFDITEAVSAGGEITLPCKYRVRKLQLRNNKYSRCNFN